MSDGLDPILQQKEQQQLKTQLFWRLGIAGGVIAALLGGIAWLEKNQENGDPNVQITQIAPELNASEPAQIASAASAASAVASASPEPSPLATASPSANPSSTPTTAPTADSVNSNHSPIQKIENAPKSTNKPTPSIKPQARPEMAATAIPLKTANTTDQPAAKIQATSAATQTNKAVPDFPAAINSARGYSVQAGVFLHATNAEKLLGQLQQAGIPAYLETRVQIGPFKNKAEADAAVKKLKALGITPIVKTE